MKFTDFCQRLIQMIRREEYRCEKCADRAVCPAANTGVCYPCPYYRKKN